MRLPLIVIGALAFVVLAPCFAHAQTTLSGSALALHSSGAADGDAWTLFQNGYVGTYIRLEAPGTAVISVNASGSSNNAIPPHLNVAVGDIIRGWDISPATALYDAALPLSAGVHFLRIELTNDDARSNRSLTVISVTVSGAAVLNSNSDENALASAATYATDYRKGNARIHIPWFAPGTDVRVKLSHLAFNLGGITSGLTSFPDLENNPAPGSQADRYQQFVNTSFNTLVPSNGGKWAYNEANRDTVTMEAIDSFSSYVQAHNLKARMHTMLWDTNQQPGWVQDLMAQAAAGDVAARAALREEIFERINYYVRQRAKNFAEIDVLNESLHRPRYLEIFGEDGIAEIFSRVNEALQDANSLARPMLNEFNVLQFSVNPMTGMSDPFANWYRSHVENIRDAGGRQGGIGIQYYADVRDSSVIGGNAHSAARVAQAIRNLSVTGLPISLTEFSVVTNGGTWDWARATKIMTETLRIVFGTPQATGFMFWQLRALTPDSFGLVDANWQSTPAGEAFKALRAEWDTDVLTTIANDGTIEFNGYYGDYVLTIDSQPFSFTLTKGVIEYSLPRYIIPKRPGRIDVKKPTR